MSSEHTSFAEKIAAALRQIDEDADSNESELDETDRMVALIEAVTEAFDVNDPRAVEGLFAAQGVALHVIFKDFIGRKYFPFKAMHVALRAQAQCRATFKSLNEYKNPRFRNSPTKNSSEQTVESANIATGAAA
jgi:hypothetical protein